MKNILITRPKDQAQEIAYLLQRNGFQPFIEPLFSVIKLPLIKKILPQISAIIITSANACEAVTNFPKTTKIFSVGKKTTQKLTQAGFDNIIVAPENSAESLRDLIIKTHDKAGLMLYFHGSVISLDFSQELKNLGFAVEKILAYETHEVKNFSAELLKFSQKAVFDQVLLFSLNSARIFLNLAAKHNMLEYFKHCQILCMSEKILHDVKKSGFQNSATFRELPVLKKFYD
jgi:uroporphyrinogen-III synthase